MQGTVEAWAAAGRMEAIARKREEQREEREEER